MLHKSFNLHAKVKLFFLAFRHRSHYFSTKVQSTHVEFSHQKKRNFINLKNTLKFTLKYT